MRKGISAKFSICCAFGALAACGGGGGGGGGFNSTPPPPPPPPPAPGYIDVFPNINHSKSVAVLGAQVASFAIRELRPAVFAAVEDDEAVGELERLVAPL
jgi:hypothetical protein